MREHILRAIDANGNRAKEGLRVVEDVFRFVYAHNALRRRIRLVRHAVRACIQRLDAHNIITCRDSRADAGKHVDAVEMPRRHIQDVVYANMQRAKESCRVLEELCKIIEPAVVPAIKKIRYQLYALEKDIALVCARKQHV